MHLKWISLTDRQKCIRIRIVPSLKTLPRLQLSNIHMDTTYIVWKVTTSLDVMIEKGKLQPI